MRSSFFLHSLTAVCIVTTAASASGQAIQLFGPVNVRTSTQGTGYGESANTFNSTILNLSCPASPQGKISSSSDGTGNVLVDNFISLGVGEASPVDICQGGTVEGDGQQNCFNSTYKDEASNGTLPSPDPDNFVSTGGVPAIDISSYLSSGTSQVQINLTDTGGYLASSTLYLITNCSSSGVSGPGLVTGNPIPSSNPTSQQLAQNYTFNSANNQQVQFTYDLTVAQNAGTLSIPNQSTPSTGDTLLNPANFSSKYLAGTSFATASCLLHTGETQNGSPACKLYTLTCQIGSNPSQAGALCPTSQQRNEVFQEVFDGPGFTLPDISGTNGLTYHQGVAFIEANERWVGGSCSFDSASGIANLLCPQNILTSFSGPGAYRSGGSGQSPNSDFITVAPVPEDLTTVKVAGATQQNGYWVNTHSPTVNFVSTPPAVASSNNFVPAPIESLTYGISPASSVPQPPAPIAGDTLLPNTGACPAPGGSAPANVFTPPAQSVSVSTDGQYLLHYYAQDCAGTQELKFSQDGSGNWSTTFYTYPINVDTVAPVVATGPTLSPAPSTNYGVANSYLVGQTVTANYSCTDDRSGVVKCGTSTFAPGTLSTGNLSSPVSTSTAGSQTFTVTAQDAAGNTATPVSVTYQVVQAPPVNLSILKVAPATVKQNAQMTYVLTAGNLGKQTAEAVVVTDPLPVGVTYVKATAQQLVCSNGKCSNPASCSFASKTVTCTTPSMTLLTPMLVEIVVSVQASSGTKIKNTATVTSANPEGNGYPQSTATTTVK
jgi:uncharacterized repeat protein (TIGR01451 family)